MAAKCISCFQGPLFEVAQDPKETACTFLEGFLWRQTFFLSAQGEFARLPSYFPTAVSLGVSAQIGLGVVWGSFQGGLQRVPDGLLGIPPGLICLSFI